MSTSKRKRKPHIFRDHGAWIVTFASGSWVDLPGDQFGFACRVAANPRKYEFYTPDDPSDRHSHPTRESAQARPADGEAAS